MLKLFLGNVLFLACRGAVKSDLFLKRQLAACSLSRARFLVSDFLTRMEMGFVFFNSDCRCPKRGLCSHAVLGLEAERSWLLLAASMGTQGRVMGGW